MDVPSSLARAISPPRLSKRRRIQGLAESDESAPPPSLEPTLAAVEAGKARVDDHLAYFGNRLAKASHQTAPHIARLSIKDFSALYHNNQHERGNHFVVHQHNHPRAGVHYDLRLQFSQSSSMSFALPKGLPGDPNSRSIGRLAIETRVHNYWNHLIESASNKTGSLLIWDTGTYEVLPRKKIGRGNKGMTTPQTTDDERDSSDSSSDCKFEVHKSKAEDGENENDKLIAAFQTRYIRLRLHGTRLPKGYTVVLRLPTNEIIKRPTARRKSRQKHTTQQSGYQSDPDATDDVPIQDSAGVAEEDLDTDTDEDAQTRATNAYPGSTNDIGSIHQRHWFLQLDRQNSGFELDRSGDGKGEWVRGPNGGGFEPFLVRGRDHETSVVTGRLARDVERDEGVEGYVGRGGWVGIEH
jgi:hypothetical protein